MEIIKIQNLNFKYPQKQKSILNDINLTVKKGEFLVICGRTGCGKTTLLKQLKPVIAPFGEIDGKILYKGEEIRSVDKKIQVSDIGFVNQNPENQIVTDKVWHELSFGLENLGYDTDIIRVKCAEMASYFGIEKWFYKDVSELSGGQKQILNLASVMVMNPKVLILDEPTSQLDPIWADEFLHTVHKINSDLGVTVIMTEHRLESIFPIADRVVVMENGKIILNDLPRLVAKKLKNEQNPMLEALPCASRIYSKIDNELECPLTAREGREWIENIFAKKELRLKELKKEKKNFIDEEVLRLKEVYFKYDKKAEYVIDGLSLSVRKGEIYSIVGGNGTGKTTALNLICGIYKPFRGKILCKESVALLPQNPQALFVKKTVEEDLRELLFDMDIKEEQKQQKIKNVVSILEIDNILKMHPYDLSGGEMQKVALAKILLLESSILLLDEPTKGIDNFYKEKLGMILKELKKQGKTIIMVSHDIEFAAKVSDRCGMLFNGEIVSEKEPDEFFFENNFYTTSAAKISRDIFKNAVTCEDVIRLCRENF